MIHLHIHKYEKMEFLESYFDKNKKQYYVWLCRCVVCDRKRKETYVNG